MTILKSKLPRLLKSKAETIDANPEPTEREKKESQEKTNRKRKERKLREKLNNLLLLSKPKSRNLLLPREKVEEEAAERVNSDKSM